MSKNPFSYRIDYDKAIAEDTMWLERCTKALELKLFRPDTVGTQYHYDIVDLVLSQPEIAQTMGLSASDIDDLAALAGYDDQDLPDELEQRGIAARATEGWYTRGNATLKALKAVWPDTLMTQEGLVVNIKKFRTDLARHKRNKARNT